MSYSFRKSLLKSCTDDLEDGGCVAAKRRVEKRSNPHMMLVVGFAKRNTARMALLMDGTAPYSVSSFELSLEDSYL